MASFDGSGCLLYRFSPNTTPILTAKDSISLKFKTLQNSGTLIHTEGQDDHTLTLELHKGKLLLHLRKGTVLITVTSHNILQRLLYFSVMYGFHS